MTLQKANEKRIENFLAKQIRHNGKILGNGANLLI